MIPEGWKTFKLNEITSKIGDGLHGTPIYDEMGEYYFINGSNLVNGKIVLNANTKRVSEKEFNKYKKELSEKTILIGINGTIGNIALYNNEKCILGKSAAYLNVKENFDKRFLKYLLLNDHFQKFIRNNASGTTIKNVGLALLREYEFIAPVSIEIQCFIASILASLDEKIELNLQMNKTLEAIAQAIFKEWFVDFRFPVFDGKMVDGLPKEWRKVKLGAICETTDFVANGSFASLKENVHLLGEDDFAIFVRTTDYNSGFEKGLKYVDKHSYDFLKKSKLFGNEVIISNVGDVGTVFRSPVWLNKPLTLGSNAVMIKESNFNNYLFYFLSSSVGQYLIDGIISGSAQPKFNKTSLRNLELVIPSKEIIENFNTVIDSIILKLNLNLANNRTLIQIRNGLLSKLMTGKIKVA